MFVQPINAKYWLAGLSVEKDGVMYEAKIAFKGGEPARQAIAEHGNLAEVQMQDWFDWIFREFSEKRPMSTLNRFNAGELSIHEVSPQFRTVLAAATYGEQMTNQLYAAGEMPNYHPGALVQVWAVEQAFEQHLRPLLALPEVAAVSLEGGGMRRVETKPEDPDWFWTFEVFDKTDDVDPYLEVPIHSGAIATHELIDGVAAVMLPDLTDAAIWVTALSQFEDCDQLSTITVPGRGVLVINKTARTWGEN